MNKGVTQHRSSVSACVVSVMNLFPAKNPRKSDKRKV